MACPKCGAADSMTGQCGFCGYALKNLRGAEQEAVNQGFQPTKRINKHYLCPECHNETTAERWEREVPDPATGETQTQGAWIPILHRRPNGSICTEGY